MADTFISYSRKDIAFAKIIHESLQNNQLDTWIDWQDIPPSADWFAEIKEAIEQANTLIFIISPNSVKSEICSKEIAHAEMNNKRLIPIIIEDIDAHDVPSTLMPLNWIFFKEEDQQYAKALQDLIKAITLDQPWMKAHTRIQNRALEWERSGQEGSYLLHGADLGDAENWLAKASGKDPAPTTLQTQYLVASRAQATRRQRRTLGAVAFGLVLAILLGLLAWNQRNVAVSESNMRATAQNEAIAEANMRATAQNEAVAEAHMRATAQSEAETAKVEAERQRDIALSRFYADKVIAQLDENHWELALLLAVEAGRLADTYEAVSALREVFAAPGRTLLLLEGHQDDIYSVAWSPDKSMIATTGYKDLTVRIWDAYSGEVIHIIETSDDGVTSLSWSPDGTRILGVGWPFGIGVWDSVTGEQLFRVSVETSDAAWSADGSAVLSYYGFLGSPEYKFDDYVPAMYAVYDGYQGEELFSITGIHSKYGRNAGKLITNQDKNRILVWQRNEDAFIGQVIDLETGKVFSSLADTTWLGDVVWSADDGKVAMVGEGGKALVWDVVSGELLLEVPEGPHAEGVVTASFDPTGNRLLVTRCNLTSSSSSNCFEASGHIWDIESGQEVAALSGHTSDIVTASWSPEGDRILTATYDYFFNDNTARIWDANTGMEMARFSGHTSGIAQAEWSDDGVRVFTRSAGEAVVWDAATGVAYVYLPYGNRSFVDMTWDQTSEQILAAVEKDVRVFSASAGTEGLIINAHPHGVQQAVWDPSNRFVLTSGCEEVDFRFVCQRGGLKIWDAQTGALVRGFSGHSADVVLADWNRAGDQVISASFDKTVRVWDVRSGEELLNLPHSENGIAGIAWSPDESKILTFIMDSFKNDNNAYIWDAVSGELLRKISPVESVYDDLLQEAVWSPDGSQVLTYTCEQSFKESSGCRVQIWEVETGEELLRLVNPEGKYGGAILWSPDGSLILAGNGRVLMVWDARNGELNWSIQNEVNKAGWSPDGSWIATADSDYIVRIYDSETGGEVRTLMGHTDRIRQVTWSRDGATLLTRSDDNTIRIWDSRTGELLSKMISIQGYRSHAQWSSDERYILTPSEDGTVRIWYTRLGDLLKAACEIAPRNMTQEEWQIYFGSEPYRETCPALS